MPFMPETPSAGGALCSVTYPTSCKQLGVDEHIAAQVIKHPGTTRSSEIIGKDFISL